VKDLSGKSGFLELKIKIYQISGGVQKCASIFMEISLFLLMTLIMANSKSR
jgi:hypothetical protein